MSRPMMILVSAVLTVALWAAGPAGAQSPFLSTNLQNAASPYNDFQPTSLSDSGDAYGIGYPPTGGGGFPSPCPRPRPPAA
jgi:hypothetical protein